MAMRSTLDDLRQYCEAACIKLWGEPDKRTTKELRWNGGDAYSAKTFNRHKRAWYDHGAKRGGSTLELVAYAKGKPAEKLRGKAVFDTWRTAHEMGLMPEPPPTPKANGGGKPILATYPYDDEQGALLYEVVRFDTNDPHQRFRQRRPDGKGGWIWKKGARQVLYRLPELMEGIACYLVLVCEGESDVEAARRLGYIATTHPGGVGKWRDEYDEFFRDADVVVVSDNDAHGKGQADAEIRAQHLSRVAKRVRKIMFEVKDLREWIAAGGTREQLDALIEAALDWTPQPEQAEAHQGSKKTIRIVKGEIARIVDEAEAALLAVADAVPIMVRAGMLVQPVIDQLPASHERMTDVTLLRPLTNANIIYLLNKHAAIFEQYDGRSKKWLAVDPPANAATQLLQKGQWRFPKVAGVITAPTLRPDGSILDQPGYDPATQLWYAPDGALIMPPCKKNPSREDAEQALALFDDLHSGFPFVGKVDRSVALAGQLTSVLRGAFDVAPMHLFRAHDVGSGKSLLADLMSTVTRGRECPVITNSKSVEEMEKRLGAFVLQGVPMISLDNCSGNIGGDLLCQITERPAIHIRILGKSEAPECEWRGVLLGTGNNITLVGDMIRRGLIANLDPQCERPELRTFAFDPIERVLNNRGTYIAAAITIARAYIAAGCPNVCKTPLGSYGGWSRIVRSPLVWLGRADPVKSMEEIRQEDPGRRALHDLIELWRDYLTLNTPYAASDLVFRANELANPISDYGEPEQKPQTELRELLLQQAGTARGDINTKAVGTWLMSVRGRVYAGMRIELAKQSRAHGNKYALVEIDKAKQEEK
jgi:hypothetical protein